MSRHLSRRISFGHQFPSEVAFIFLGVAGTPIFNLTPTFVFFLKRAYSITRNVRALYLSHVSVIVHNHVNLTRFRYLQLDRRNNFPFYTIDCYTVSYNRSHSYPLCQQSKQVYVQASVSTTVLATFSNS